MSDKYAELREVAEMEAGAVLDGEELFHLSCLLAERDVLAGKVERFRQKNAELSRRCQVAEAAVEVERLRAVVAESLAAEVERLRADNERLQGVARALVRHPVTHDLIAEFKELAESLDRTAEGGER